MSQLNIPSVKNQVSAEEWETRVNLAALYRLIALYGWDDLIFTHLTARVPGTDNHILINPYGLMFEEITASSLVKVDLDGKKLMKSEFEINPAGFNIHSAVHAIREDALCVVHLHTRSSIGVSAQKAGLLSLSQQATVVLRSLSYHAYEGIALNPEEKLRLQNDLGDTTWMLLQNHGLLTCANNIPDGFIQAYVLECACQAQVQAQAGGTPLIHVEQPPGIDAALKAQLSKGLGGALAWPALLRKLDRKNPGFRD